MAATEAEPNLEKAAALEMSRVFLLLGKDELERVNSHWATQRMRKDKLETGPVWREERRRRKIAGRANLFAGLKNLQVHFDRFLEYDRPLRWEQYEDLIKEAETLREQGRDHAHFWDQVGAKDLGPDINTRIVFLALVEKLKRASSLGRY